MGWPYHGSGILSEDRMKPISATKILVLGLSLTLLVGIIWLAAGIPDEPNFALAAPSLAQLNWRTVDSGGGTSSSTNFSLTGTLGQPDASQSSEGMVGGAFRIQGGFWTGGAVEHSLYLPFVRR